MADAAVWKFRLKPHSSANTVDMPSGAKVLHAAWQDDAPHVWALVDPDARSTEPRRFRVLATGERDVDLSTARYIGTCHAPDATPYVLHVFEEVDRG